MKYCLKSEIVDVWRNEDDSPFPGWVDGVQTGRKPGGVLVIVSTVRGYRFQYLVELGDYLARNTRGEVYPIKPDMFNDLYEKING